MLLRSSSTPVLGSLLSSFSDSPNRDVDTNSSNNNPKKLHFFHGGHSNFSSSSCSSSPITASNSGLFEMDRKPMNMNSSTGFRRAQSDGNLEGLAAAAEELVFDSDQSLISRSSHRQRTHISPTLQTIPSFSFYNSHNGCEEEEEEDDDNDDDDDDDGDGDKDFNGDLERTVTIGPRITEVGGSGEFSFGKNLCLIKEEDQVEEANEQQPPSPPLYLARGLGIDSSFGGAGAGGGGYFAPAKFGDGGHEESSMEEHYKRMVEENPGNSLFLRNYAQFLYESKGDLHGAEEYYARAILSDPGDGELLSRYAKLVWELHHDQEKASSYFERSVQIAPQDSHVLAAYASFLWDTEDENDEHDLPPAVFHIAGMTPASA